MVNDDSPLCLIRMIFRGLEMYIGIMLGKSKNKTKPIIMRDINRALR